MSYSSPSQPHTNAPFFLGLSVILLVGFAQVILFGLGVMKKLKAEPEVKIVEKVVPRFVAVRPADSPKLEAPKPREIKPLPDLPPLPKNFTSQRTSAAPPENTAFTFDPPVTDPLEERLLKEAKTARVAGDMRAMSLKLAEAENSFTDSPHVLFLYADLYEAMGIFDKASEYYEKVFSKGLAESGSLYRISAQKLKQGFLVEKEPVHALAIGTVNQFLDNRIETGESISLTIPILSSPEELIDPSQVSVSVRIFDSIDGEVVPCLPSNKAIVKWGDYPVDWQSNGIENLLADYYLPSTPAPDDYGMLGARKYHGYSIELSYRGQLVDQYAWPRILASKIETQPDYGLFDFPYDDTDLDINYDNPLLPPPLDNY